MGPSLSRPCAEGEAEDALEGLFVSSVVMTVGLFAKTAMRPEREAGKEKGWRRE